MEKLELKHLAPYAIHGIFVEVFGNKDILTGIDFEHGIVETLNNNNCLVEDLKIYLRPLSDLTDNELKEFFNDSDIDIVRMKYAIVVNYKMMGEWFKETIPLRKVLEDWTSNLVMSAWLYNKLLENHYDLFGLIEKGLAIDKNTLQKPV